MKHVFRKTFGTLAPADKGAEELLAKISDAALVMAEVKQARNPDHHRKFFAVLHAILPSTEFASVEALLTAIKIAIGYVDTAVMGDGTVVYHPRSICFDAMSQGEFNEFYTLAMDAICARILPGMNRDDLERHLVAA